MRWHSTGKMDRRLDRLPVIACSCGREIMWKEVWLDRSLVQIKDWFDVDPFRGISFGVSYRTFLEYQRTRNIGVIYRGAIFL